LKDYQYIPYTQSTNNLLKERVKSETLPEFFAVRTAFQMAGKGQMGNSWESERGKNLLFSFVLYPHHIPLSEQFYISQIVSLALVQVLIKRGIDARIKWPNDIYVNDKKIAGILIENSLRGNRMEYSIVGVGLNVNQQIFKSDAPNPVSMLNILAYKTSITALFSDIRNQLIKIYTKEDTLSIAFNYQDHLIRTSGFHRYKNAENIEFEASFERIDTDGQLWLKLTNGELQGFYFKEVSYVF
jgi:BirA family biotin operon repressor/biotin-[acetyl-CoA-carboxylase] ligase